MDGAIKIHQRQAVLILRQKEHVMIPIIVGGRQTIGVILSKAGIAQPRHGEREVSQTSQETYKMTGILDAIYLTLTRRNAIIYWDVIILVIHALL